MLDQVEQPFVSHMFLVDPKVCDYIIHFFSQFLLHNKDKCNKIQASVITLVRDTVQNKICKSLVYQCFFTLKYLSFIKPIVFPLGVSLRKTLDVSSDYVENLDYRL